MPYYRLYLVDDADHFTRAEEAIVETDAAAIAKGLALATTQKVEVWQESRKVGTIPPQISK